MFPSDLQGILPDNGLKSTCAICGEPIDIMEKLAGFPLGKPSQCKVCKQPICSKHFSKSRQKCVKCETGRDNWCQTPVVE
jgi:hypothetical protein